VLKELGFIKKQCRLNGVKGYYWSKDEGGVTEIKKHQDNNRTEPTTARDSIVNKLSYVLTEKEENTLSIKDLDKRHYCNLVQSDMTLRTIQENLVSDKFEVSQAEIEMVKRHQESEI